MKKTTYECLIQCSDFFFFFKITSLCCMREKAGESLSQIYSLVDQDAVLAYFSTLFLKWYLV